MTKYFWMAVTADKYELPVVTAESSLELADLLGVHPGTVRAREWRHRSGRNSGIRIVKVPAV